MSWAVEISRSVEHTGWADEMGWCKEHTSWAVEITRSAEHTGWADEMGRCKEHTSWADEMNTQAQTHTRGKSRVSSRVLLLPHSSS